MTIQESFDLLFSWVGVTFPDFVLIVVILSSLIFAAKDYRIGLISCLLLSLMSFVFFVLNEIDATRALILFFVTLILMSFSVYTSRQQGGLF